MSEVTEREDPELEDPVNEEWDQTMARPNRRLYYLETRVGRMFRDLSTDLEKTVAQVTEFSDKLNRCIKKENDEIIPLIVRVNQGISEPLERVIRDSNANALTSLNNLLAEHLSSLNFSAELNNKLKDLIVTGFAAMEQETRNHLNHVALIVKNLGTTFNNKFSAIVKFFTQSMTDLKTTLRGVDLTPPKEESCCFKEPPQPDDRYFLHQRGFYYTKELSSESRWGDVPFGVGDFDFLKDVSLYVSMYHEFLSDDIETIKKARDTALSYQAALEPITSLTEQLWLSDKVLLLDKIIAGCAPFTDIRKRILREVPSLYPGSQKVPMIYCNEHISTFAKDLRACMGPYNGVRVCSFHLKKLKEAGFVTVEGVENRISTTHNEPVFYVKLLT